MAFSKNIICLPKVTCNNYIKNIFGDLYNQKMSCLKYQSIISKMSTFSCVLSPPPLFPVAGGKCILGYFAVPSTDKSPPMHPR